MRPQFGYARSGEVSIAYQVVGNGPIDLVFVMGWVSHLDAYWEEPRFARFLERLASFSRVILFDKRGTGLSDAVPINALPTLEQRMDDVRAVMDAVGSTRAALLGASEGAPMSALFAATYPDRCAALVMVGGYARRLWAPDYPWAPTMDKRLGYIEDIQRGWGGPVGLDRLAPSLADDEPFRAWWSSYLRRGASPGAAVALAHMNMEIDIRKMLHAIHVPTLVIHRTDDIACPVGGGRYMAEHIPGARFVELPGRDHLVFVGNQDEVIGEVEQFLTGVRRIPADEPDRVLATVMATEIVDAAQTATRLGDVRWRDVLGAYDRVVRDAFSRHRARRESQMMDGWIALFDGPARAVRCAREIVEGGRKLGLRVRAGLHTGEVLETEAEVVGVAMHLATRVRSHAAPGSVLVSQTVNDLVAGSGLAFDLVGDQVFAGLPGEWKLYEVADGSAGERIAPVTLHGAGSRLAVLSPREREVAALVALGLSNRQIADELSISPATVERHVANMLTKLGHRSRAQIAAWATEQGLTRTAAEQS
jgi:pimeloyl-ACP methyl ester carboxylesterase/DNA-binding CsgD family transcriptional regulator